MVNKNVFLARSDIVNTKVYLAKSDVVIRNVFVARSDMVIKEVFLIQIDVVIKNVFLAKSDIVIRNVFLIKSCVVVTNEEVKYIFVIIIYRSHCSCDALFRECLRKTNSLVSTQIGLTYFNVLGPQCFRKAHPIVKCIKRTRLVFSLLLLFFYDT